MSPEQRKSNNAPTTKHRWFPRFGLKSLLLLITLAAVLIQYSVIVKKQQEAVDTLLGQGAEVRFGFELDSDGNEIPNARSRVPKFLIDKFGIHWFCSPVSVQGGNLDMRVVGKLTNLRTLNMERSLHHGRDKKMFDLRDLAGLKKLKSLTLGNYLNGTDGLAELSNLETLKCRDCYIGRPFEDRGDQRSFFATVGKLKKLKTLDVAFGRPPPKKERDLRPLGNLSELRELKLTFRRSSRHYFYDFGWLGKLEKLETVKLLAGDAGDSLSKLKRLENLSLIGSSPSFHPRDLANCTGLKSLTINSCPLIEDVEWLAKLTDLEFLEVTPYCSGYYFEIKDTSLLHNLKNLKELDFPISAVDFELELLKSTKLTLNKIRGYRRHHGYKFRLAEEEKKLDLAHSGIRNLKLLPDSLLEGALLHDNRIEDISRLAEQTELKTCNLSKNPITDVAALSGCRKLVVLDLSDCPVNDVRSLKDCRELKTLNLSRTKIRELPDFSDKLLNLMLNETPLEGFKSSALGRKPGVGSSVNDVRVDLSKTRVRDLAKIPTHFNRVKLCDTDVSDLSPLKDWRNIIHLDLSGTKIRDLSTLPALPHLTHLDLSRTALADLTGIEKLPALKSLTLVDTQVSDLNPLLKLTKLGELDVSGTKVQDLNPVSQMKSLGILMLDRTEVIDISPLKTLKLEALGLAETRVSDLAALKDMHAANAYEAGIKWLDVSRTQVADLKPLEKYGWLNHFNISGTKVQSLKDINGSIWNFYSLDCPVFTLENRDWKRHVEGVHVDCTAIKDLSPLGERVGLRRITLQNLQPWHRLDWLAKLSNTYSLRLTILGPPIELNGSLEIRIPPNLSGLTLPEGSRIAPEIRKQLRNTPIRFGKEKVSGK